MICNKCGKEIPDNSNFCEFCGTQIDAKSMKKTKKVHNKESKVKDSNRKTGKKILIIGSIAVAVAALAVVFVMLFAGRSIDKTIDKYMEAIREEDDDLLLKIMFPKDARNNGEAWYADRTIYDILKDMNEEVEDISVVDIVDADNKISDVVDDIFYEADVNIEFTELKIVKLDIQNKKGSEESQLIAYKVGNKWYILPEAFEYCVDSWQSEDVKSAEAIAISIQTALANEEVYDNFAPYYDVVIDLESDLEYLPESVQTSIMDCLVKIPEIQHTYGGAVGFSFVVNSKGGVVVYASTENNLTAWQIYPSVDNGYHDGVVQTVDEEGTEQAPIDNEYSYVKLICEQSPIMGYWQSDKAGMYIGYNVSGGDEGFTIYLQSQDVSFQLLHSYEGYTYSGGTGNIRLTKDDSEHTVIYDIQVVDDDTIKLVFTDERYDIAANTEYTFKRAELTKETLSEYEGTWIAGGQMYNGLASYGDVIDLAYCDECGSIHDKDYVECENTCYYGSKYVSLYDGKTLHYIAPKEGLYIEEMGSVSYESNSYTIDGDMMEYETWFYGNGGELLATYLREGSDEAKVAEALNAYQQYITNNTKFFVGVELVYVDGDVIPECVVRCQFDAGLREREYMLTYYDGQVVVLDNNMTGSSISLKDGQNEIRYDYQGSMMALEGTEIYILEEGVFKQKADIYRSFGTPDSTEYVWYVDDVEVDEATYNQTLNNIGEYPIAVVGQYSSLRDAYNSLKTP